MPQTENQFRYFADKGEHGELWLDGPCWPPPDGEKSYERRYNSRLHYSCSPELKALLKDRQVLKESEFGVTYQCKSPNCECFADYNPNKYCRKKSQGTPIAIPLPDAIDVMIEEQRKWASAKPKEDKPERLFTLEKLSTELCEAVQHLFDVRNMKGSATAKKNAWNNVSFKLDRLNKAIKNQTP